MKNKKKKKEKKAKKEKKEKKKKAKKEKNAGENASCDSSEVCALTSRSPHLATF